MARVTGPLMSIDASGSIAGAIVFSKWRGRNYVRRHAVPSNPRTPGQVAARAIMAFCGREWDALGDPAKGTWLEAADSAKISAFNQYVKINARNWRDQMMPSQDSPAERIIVGDAPTAIDLTASGRQVLVEITLADDTGIWGIAICRSLITGFTPAAVNAVWILPASVTPRLWVDGPLVPGTYYYSAFAFSTDGLVTDACTEASVVVA